MSFILFATIEFDYSFIYLGVFAASIKLADAPVLGDWNITVDVSGQLFHQSFLVAEYILPKFDVEVIVPEYGRSVFQTFVTRSISYSDINLVLKFYYQFQERIHQMLLFLVDFQIV